MGCRFAIPHTLDFWASWENLKEGALTKLLLKQFRVWCRWGVQVWSVYDARIRDLLGSVLVIRSPIKAVF